MEDVMKAWLVILLAVASASAHSVVITHSENENLYLGNDNVSCGRYTLTDGSPLLSVRNYCVVSQEVDYADGTASLKIQTDEDGTIECHFINGGLDKCFEND